MKIVGVDEMRRLEAVTDEAGHSYAAMMELAGKAVADAILTRYVVSDCHAVVLVGPGNNGGDGLVAARYLAEAGVSVVCYLAKPRDEATDENYRRACQLDIPVLVHAKMGDGEALSRLASDADFIVDALLGTGTQLPLRGSVVEILRIVRRSQSSPVSSPALTSLSAIDDPAGAPRPFVIAVDGPTGLDFETGEVDAAALEADVTVTFAFPKPAHFRFPGAGLLGELIVADIGIDPARAAADLPIVVTPQMVAELLPRRPLNAHKGTFGRALIVAGSANYTGAARLAGLAACRSGCGLVTLAVPSAIHTAVAAGLAEATYLLLPESLGTITESAASLVKGRLPGYDALLIGPGIGREHETASFVERLLDHGRPRHRQLGFVASVHKEEEAISLPPVVVDADGLNILSEMDDWDRCLPPGSILTPHPGEMARLSGESIADIQADRVATAVRWAERWGHILVLKGAHTVVASPAGRVAVEPFANPGLATAGTGDVLAGTIVSLLAQGGDEYEAAIAGAYIHGLAGEMASIGLGAPGMVAGDVVDYLPSALQRLARYGDE